MPAGIALTQVNRTSMSEIAFSLSPVPPFRLDLTAWALRRRPRNAVDRWDGRTYGRVLVLSGRPVAVSVVQTGPPQAPRLRIRVAGPRLAADAKAGVAAALERLLGIRTDLTGFYRLAARDPRLGGLVAPYRGVKPPRFASVFESLVNAFACQQVSLAVGIELLNRLVAAYGAAVVDDGERAFPEPGVLAALEPGALRPLGFSRQKEAAIVELARGVAGGRLDLEGLAALDDAEAVARLQALRGVGRWTAEYVLLRGLGRLHVFPGDDVGARGNLERWLRRRAPLDYDGVRRALARWRPYGGLVYFHLLLSSLAAAGHLR